MSHESGFAARLDADVLARARRQDRTALGEIYQLYARAALALGTRMLGQHAAAEDAIHDGFLCAFERLRGYRGDAPFGAWLKRIMVNSMIDRLRSEKRRGEEPISVEPAAGGASEGGAAVDARRLLDRLAPRARAVVVMHEVEGYAHAEIAALFGQSESWSKSVVARSLAALRRGAGE